MKKITVDEDLLNRLGRFEEDFEFCDASGRVLAVTKRKITPEEWSVIETEAGISLEELERRADEPGKGFSTAEFLRYDEQL